jgi:hypothetical protein
MKTRRTTLGLLLPLLLAVAWLGLSTPSPQKPRSALLSASLQVPSPVRPVLDRACLDCHSYETRWPWSSRIPLVSWLIQHDVNKAREHLNFSTWTGSTPHLATSNEIQEICDAVADGAMPPRRYRLMHPDAQLSEDEKESFCDWADQMRNVGSESRDWQSLEPPGEPAMAGGPR